MRRSVIFILINILLERYCWTGTTNILVMYLHEKLEFDEGISTSLYHTVELLVFVFPIVGAIAADNYFGLYKTLIWTSLIFACGNLIIAIGAIEILSLPKVAFTLTGMFLFIPCGFVRSSLNTFGPDQYELPKESEEFKSYFFVQMIFVKIGAFLGRFVNPIFREDVKCFDSHDCYPLAFGFPAIMMLFGLFILLIGKNSFVRKPPGGDMFTKVFFCMTYALKEKTKHKSIKKDHWLDYAEDKFDKKLIEDTKAVFRTLTIFLGIALVWSCFMQQNSRWIFQAAKMDGDLGFYKLKPDQIIALNPISCLLLTPVCVYGIYPLLEKCGFGSLLNRMAIGGFLCCASFVLAILVEIYIQNHYISMLWLLPQYSLSALCEIFVLVSMLNFAYEEAPANMKSVMTACVYLTIALGDSLIPIVSGSKIFKSQAMEFTFFASLLFVNMIVFCFIVRKFNRKRQKNEVLK
ncbi:hypothetical protein PVAND_012676 [Polypedilum vanderplanki]|uniref:Uncharacterized protein n=1 Tax=Polypedilum vanderplanki TaxID=319348 RepID=A0A9J6CNE8_POLVA|nr:hypothetical protein PVAND_012676 [Polypedilum vanderplanki]